MKKKFYEQPVVEVKQLEGGTILAGSVTTNPPVVSNAWENTEDEEVW